MSKTDKYFAQDLRRMLYLIQIMNYQIDWMKEGIKHSPSLKVAMQNFKNSNNRLLLELRCMCKNDSWELVKKDLSEEFVHDLAILMDECFEVADLGGIIKAIQTVKEQWRADMESKTIAA